MPTRRNSLFLSHPLTKKPKKISAINKVDRKIEAAKSELEETIEIKLDKITDDHAKNINSFHMKLSAITSNKPYSYYEQSYAYLIK